MKYALVDGKKMEATPMAQGLCQGCGSIMIPRCGDLRVRHWAHKGRRFCDPWWENETEWHREWKDKFPSEWQEYFYRDEQSGEKHIADVRTEHGLIIEFQHSYLKLEERSSRETFYQNMIWVVDGSRLKRDYPRFLKGMEDADPILKQGIFHTYFPEECFPRNWLESSVPVFFDFRNATPADPSKTAHDHLWCLLPGRAQDYAVILKLSFEDFVKVASNRSQILTFKEIVNECGHYMRQRQAENRRIAEQAFMQQELLRRQIYARQRNWRGRRRRNIRL